MSEDDAFLSRLVEVLRSTPGLSARDCVRELRAQGIMVEKKTVNAILYRSSEVYSQGDGPPRWFLIEDFYAGEDICEPLAKSAPVASEEILRLLQSV